MKKIENLQHYLSALVVLAVLFVFLSFAIYGGPQNYSDYGALFTMITAFATIGTAISVNSFTAKVVKAQNKLNIESQLISHKFETFNKLIKSIDSINSDLLNFCDKIGFKSNDNPGFNALFFNVYLRLLKGLEHNEDERKYFLSIHNRINKELNSILSNYSYFKMLVVENKKLDDKICLLEVKVKEYNMYVYNIYIYHKKGIILSSNPDKNKLIRDFRQSLSFDFDSVMKIQKTLDELILDIKTEFIKSIRKDATREIPD